MAINVTGITHIAKLDVEIVLSYFFELFGSLGVKFRFEFNWPIEWSLTSDAHMMFRLDFLNGLLEGFFISIFFLKHLKIRLNIRIDVLFVAFKWVIEHVNTQINLFWLWEQQQLIRILLLDLVGTDTSSFVGDYELSSEFFFLFVELTSHSLYNGARLARSFQRWLLGFISLLFLLAFPFFLVFGLFFVKYDWLGRVVQVNQLRAQNILVH